MATFMLKESTSSQKMATSMLKVTYTKCHYTELPTPLRTSQTSGHSSSYISNIPLWSLKSPPSHGSKIIFFHLSQSKCTVSRNAMGTLTCKIRQRTQKLQREKSRCFAQKRHKLESSKIRVPRLRGSFNQRARDSSSLERTKIPRRIARFLVGFSFYTPFARSLHGRCTVRVFCVGLCRALNCCAIRALFCIR